MKKVLFVICFICVGSAVLFSQSKKKVAQLKVDGTKMVDQNNKSIVLRGISYGWHNWWPRFYNAGTVEWFANDWKCNVVRAAMGIIDKEGGYLEKPDESKKLIKNVVDAAIKNNIYVIIDWHSHELNLKEAKKFFTEMAQTYGTHANIIYEIYNEPIRDSWSDVKAYSEEIIATIRAIDPDNIILVGSPHWDQDVHIVADDPIKNVTNVMYTLHFYAATHKKYLRDRGDYAIKKGIPLFVSECAGMEANGDGALNMKEWEKWIEWMENNKISWVTWMVSDKDETCSFLKPSANSKGKWTDDDLTESAKKTRAFLRDLNKK